jgi:hypothetical protein
MVVAFGIPSKLTQERSFELHPKMILFKRHFPENVSTN